MNRNSPKLMLAAVGLAVASGVSNARAPIVDGVLDVEYGSPLSVQTSNVIDDLVFPTVDLTITIDNSNNGGVGGYVQPGTVSDPFTSDPATVTTGVEIAIPLSELGYVAGPGQQVRVAGGVNGGGHDFFSNQFIGGFGGSESENLGEPRNVDLSALSGLSFVTINPAVSPGVAATIDGVKDAAYGPALWVQDIGTAFGNNTDATRNVSNGSEIDAVYGYVHAGVLYLFVAGNVETNFNKLDLFFDVRSGGQQKLRGDNANVDFNGLNRMGDDGSDNGLIFETGFEADYWLGYTGGNNANPEHYLNAAVLEPAGGGAGNFVGGGARTTNTPLTGAGPNAGTITIDSDYSNIGGVAGRSAGPGGGSEADESAPATVTTGVEFRVNLEGLGYEGGAGSIDLTALIVNQNWNYMSNQAVGGLTQLSALDPYNLGSPAKDVDLNNWDGNQFVTVNVPGSPSSTPLNVDGTRDSAYGAPLWVNTTNGTGFGDNDLFDIAAANGSELDAIYATVREEGGELILYVFAAGNLHDYNRMLFFFDTTAGGRNDLRGDHPFIDDNKLNTGLGGPDGFTFDTGFEADYVISYHAGFNAGDNDYTHFADGAHIFTDGGGFGGRFGGGSILNNGPIVGSVVSRIGFGDNTDPDIAIANGSELDAVYARVEGGRLYLFFAGNLASDFTRFDLFFDTIAGGQNTLIYDNPLTPANEGNPIVDFDALGRMGGLVEVVGDPPSLNVLAPGLTFDAGFEADFYMTFNTGNAIPGFGEVYGSFARLRPNAGDPGEGRYFGVATTGSGFFFGGDNPFGDTVRGAIDNSNVDGVDGGADPYGDPTTDPATVATGIEISMPLTDLAWNGTSQIKFTAFINGQGHGFVSNQVMQSVCAFDLGDPRNVDFSSIDGDQFVGYPTPSVQPDDCENPVVLCEGDANGDLVVDFADLNTVLTNWEAVVTPGTNGDIAPFPGGDGVVDFNDLNAILSNWEESCLP